MENPENHHHHLRFDFKPKTVQQIFHKPTHCPKKIHFEFASWMLKIIIMFCYGNSSLPNLFYMQLT